jgi:hypothetical protein
VKGKLLVLHLTHRGNSVPLALTHLSEEDFFVYSSPFTSLEAYASGRDLIAGPLPFLGLFFCPTSSPSDAQLLDRLCDTDDLIRATDHVRSRRRELAARRDTFRAKNSNRKILSEQDLAYEAALAEMRRLEEEERLAEERKKADEAERKAKRSGAAARYNALQPVPPNANPADIMSVKFLVQDREPKVRDFLKSDIVQRLFDFIDIDFAPLLPVLMYGFPPTKLDRSEKCVGKTLAEFRFAKKEIVRVITDGEGEEEDE